MVVRGRAGQRAGGRGRKRALLVSVAMLAGAAAGVGAHTALGATPSVEPAVFVAVAPQRILDTRDGTGGHLGKLTTDMNLAVRGVAGVPNEAVAVTMNVTVTEPTEAGFLALQPAGAAPNIVSNINFVPGATVANTVTVKLGATGEVWIHNYAGSVHVVADIAGYYVPGSGAPGPEGPQGPAGPVGAQGPNGNTILNGVGAPAAETGVGGDFYIDTASTTLYGPKSDVTGWPGVGVALIGPAGSGGLASFGSAYELATIADATVVGGADVPLSNNGPLSAIAHTAGTTTVIVMQAGVYRVDYGMSFTSGVGAELAVAVNGVVDSSSTVPLLVSTGQVEGSAMLSLAAGDVVTLRNNSAVALTMALAPSVGAQLSIEQISS